MYSETKRRIINYFNSYMNGEYKEIFGPVQDLIDSHSRQRYIIQCYQAEVKAYQKVPKLIRRIFGCKI